MENARFYTAARRIPQLIGKLPGGGHLWGGPYTAPQVGVFLGSVWLLWKTHTLWGRFGFFMNIAVAVGVVFVATWAAGRIPTTGRNPLSMGLDAVGLVAGPARLLGADLEESRPTVIKHRITVVGVGAQPRSPRLGKPTVAALDEPSSLTSPASPVPDSGEQVPFDDTSTPTPSGSRVQLTGVGAVLAAVVSRKEHDDA
jgi:hypothetical protein